MSDKNFLTWGRGGRRERELLFFHHCCFPRADLLQMWKIWGLGGSLIAHHDDQLESHSPIETNLRTIINFLFFVDHNFSYMKTLLY